MRFLTLFLMATLGLVAGPVRAERVQVFSLRGLDCAECAPLIQAQLAKVTGVKKAVFDRQKVEMTVTLADGVSNDAVLAAIHKAGFVGVVGPGQGAYLPFATYPDSADVLVLSPDGRAVGDLSKLRVPSKYTAFDVYADWCGPCRDVDHNLRDIVSKRRDIAVRKLNVVSFDTPLARELGRRLTALPYVVVFAPDGKRTDITGNNPKKLGAALGAGE
jgi:thiol-disulfide isomerase/thioredoxin/copper chaperone CopZ